MKLKLIQGLPCTGKSTKLTEEPDNVVKISLDEFWPLLIANAWEMSGPEREKYVKPFGNLINIILKGVVKTNELVTAEGSLSEEGWNAVLADLDPEIEVLDPITYDELKTRWEKREGNLSSMYLMFGVPDGDDEAAVKIATSWGYGDSQARVPVDDTQEEMALLNMLGEL